MAEKFLSEEWAAAYTESSRFPRRFPGSHRRRHVRTSVQRNRRRQRRSRQLLHLDCRWSVLGCPRRVRWRRRHHLFGLRNAAAISQGDMNTQTAFMTGKIKVTGNLAVLMMNQNIITQWGAAGETVEVEY